MSHAHGHIPVRFRNLDEAWRAIAAALRQLANGRSNAVGTVTLAQNQTSTVVTDVHVGEDSVIAFMPTTANAASIDSAGMYVSAVADGSFTITHDSNAATDRTFKYSIQG